MKTLRAAALLWVLVGIAVGGAKAQNRREAYIDSLQTELQKAASDTNKVLLFCELSSKYSSLNTDEGLRYANEALALAKDLNWEKGVALARGMIGRNHWRKGNFEEARKYHFQALEFWKKSGDNNKVALLNLFIGQDYGDAGMYPEALNYLSRAKDAYAKLGNLRNLGIVHGIIAWVYQNLGMHPESLKHQYESLKMYEKIGDRHGMAIIYGNLGDTYAEQGDYEAAIKTLRESLKIKLEFEDFINAANAYYDIGNYFLKLKNYPEALKNQQQALEIGKKIKDNNILGRAYRAIGAICMAQENYAEALKNMQLSIAAFRAVNNKMQLVNLYTELGTCYVKTNRLDEARTAFNQARALIEELNSTPEQNTYYRTVVELDSATGNWKAAFEHYKLFVQTRDSMYNEENTKKIVQTRMQYAFDKKEAAAKAEQEKREALAQQELRRQKLMRNGFMGGFAVVLLFAGVFFYQRNKIKKGKRRSDELLLNILPAEVADELKAKGSADAKLIDEVTVLFSDFKDFTQLSETLTPEDLVAEINACFSAFDLIMQKHGVEKIKTVGDAYLAAGGLPVPNATHAQDVLNAALEMQKFMRARKQQRQAEDKFFFEARIGVHTGPVVAGIVGLKKFAYDIWGDTVNTAQRMESSGEADKVNISGSTYELVKEQFACTYRGKIAVKGKGEADMYFVEG